jgi:hypothetical protein
MLLSMLHLARCRPASLLTCVLLRNRDVLIGNALAKGISGGQVCS